MYSTKSIKLSIIVPVYNVQDYIRPCIESLFCQDLDEKSFEVIIVNDGTKDRSMEMIDDIVRCHNNISIVNQENQGLSMARNNGIALAKGEYILMPDSDDLLIENKLKPLLDKAIETKVDLLVAEYIAMNNTNIETTIIQQQTELTFTETTGKEMFACANHENYVWRTLFKKDFLLENNIHFIPGIFFEDIPFTNKCYLYANKCIKANAMFYIYRRRESSISSTDNFNMKKANDLCIAIAKIWELKNDKRITQDLFVKLNDQVFLYFHNLLYRTLFTIEPTSNKITVLKKLLALIPDLKFTNGYKQIFISFLFRKVPSFYIHMLLFRKKIIWKL